MFDEFFRIHSKEFDKMMVNRVAKHLAELDRLKPSKGIHCELIGSTADWRKNWPLKPSEDKVE